MQAATDNQLIQAHTKADHLAVDTTTTSAAPTPPDQAPPRSAMSDFPIACVKGVFDVTT
jgi:hypothetical protein